MKPIRFTPICLAGLIQLLPLGRTLAPVWVQPGQPASILVRWMAGVAAVLGTFHTVSGASNTISSASTATGTVGKSFIYRITTSAEAANTWKWEPATPTDSLPPGLSLIITKPTPGVVRGTPTRGGVYHTRIWASDHWQTDRTISKLVTFTIIDTTVAPTITTQPQGQTVPDGSPVSFTVAAGGTAPLSYEWLLDGIPIPGETAPVLNFSSVTQANAGTYQARVTNSAGSALSDPAVLVVNPRPFPAPPTLGAPILVDGEIDFSFYGAAGVQYVIEYADDLVPGYWRVLRTLPAEPVPWLVHVTDVPALVRRWYRVRAE